LPAQVVNLWNTGQLDTEMVVAQAVEPNFAYARRNGDGSVKIVPGSFVYKEIYWLKGQNNAQPLSVAGSTNRRSWRRAGRRFPTKPMGARARA